MFITRKEYNREEYNRALERARREDRERINIDYYIQNRLDDMARDMNIRLERLEEEVCRLKGEQSSLLNGVEQEDK